MINQHLNTAIINDQSIEQPKLSMGQLAGWITPTVVWGGAC